MSTMLLRMSKDSRRYSLRCAATGDHIRELFVFVSQCARFQTPVIRRSLQSLRKVAPVASIFHWACGLMRARRK